MVIIHLLPPLGQDDRTANVIIFFDNVHKLHKKPQRGKVKDKVQKYLEAKALSVPECC